MMLTAFLMTSLGLAQEPPPPPIVGGETTTDFAPVGALLAVSGNQGSDFCSGTLVADDWLITAAHCIEAAEEYDRYGYDIYFCTGNNLYSNNGIDECDVAVDMIPHPDYNSNTLNADIGVIELSTGLRASGHYAMNSTRPGNFSEDTVTYVGWGITDDNANDSGRKRTADIPYAGFDSVFIFTYDPNEELNLCSGDSGGAALMWDDGEWELVGANSFVASSGGGTCSGRDAYAGATRVDAYYYGLTF
jgi:secreted trypsin-like serine protease